MEKPEKVYLTIRIEKKTRDALAEIANREHRSLGNLAAAWLIDALEQRQGKKRKTSD
jgi:hypothetical protein